MQFIRLTKFAELKRSMGIDPKFLKKEVTKDVVGVDANGTEVTETITATEGLFSLDDNGKNIYIGAATTIELTPDLAKVELEVTPVASKYDAIFVELSPGAAMLGAICTTATLQLDHVYNVYILY